MKVRELIEKLKEMNPDATVYTNQTDCCQEFRPAESIWATAESERDYSKRYNDPDAYVSVDSVRVS